MRRLLAVVAALFLAGCSASCVECRAHPVAETIFVTQDDTGVSALATVGARNVRVLLVRPPSIVLLREVFLPEGEVVSDVHWSPAGLIVETTHERFALDTRTWRLAALPASTHRVMART